MADDNAALTNDDLDLVSSPDKDPNAATEGWANNIEDEGLRTALSKFESQENFLDTLGFEVAGEPEDWRADLPDELKSVAERFPSKEDAMRSIVALQKREGQIRVPGKDASETELNAYHKAVGVPDSVEDYEFPELPEGQELNDEIEASRAEWATRFYDLNVPKDTAKQLSQLVNEDVAKQMSVQVEADKTFAASQEDALKIEWKGDDYDKNKTLANRAFAEITNRAGLSVEELTKIETKDGRLLMDRAEMLRMFAVIGREMTEGTLGPTLTDAERETVDEQLRDLRKQTADAQSEGDSKRANLLYQREQELISKKQGNAPIVGSAGRVS